MQFRFTAELVESIRGKRMPDYARLLSLEPMQSTDGKSLAYWSYDPAEDAFTLSINPDFAASPEPGDRYKLGQQMAQARNEEVLRAVAGDEIAYNPAAGWHKADKPVTRKANVTNELVIGDEAIAAIKNGCRMPIHLGGGTIDIVYAATPAKPEPKPLEDSTILALAAVAIDSMPKEGPHAYRSERREEIVSRLTQLSSEASRRQVADIMRAAANI